MELKRVVVTGLGALTLLAILREYWNALIEGKSGAAPITYFNTEKFKRNLLASSKILRLLIL